ncbi:hypothetical protein [Corallibacter sp.]|uniref:hypothetical protein n=1 Tax=Corallibacter sp. TaxID=2038084 RepID=UPI003AB40962
MRASIIICIIVFLISCNKKTYKEEDVISEIKAIYISDQKYRRVLNLVEEIDNCEGQINTLSSNNSAKTQLIHQLIYKDIIKKQDSINTLKLIELIKNYGFPGMDYLNHDIPIFMVFVHSEKKYFKEIRDLIELEYKRGHISKFEKDYIFWHLNGRNGIIPHIKKPINYRTNEKIINGILQ